MTPLTQAGPPLLMGIDIGAGSLKTMIVDESGKVLGAAAADIVTRSPQPGFSDQDPLDWWRAVCTTVPKALEQAGAHAARIGAVSFSAGAHTPVLEDAQGKVLRPAILWSDQRSGAQSQRLQQQHGQRILEISLNQPTPTWTMPQFLWLAENEPETVRATRRVYVAKDWLRAQMTGDWVTDATEATGTLLFDPIRKTWSPELCDMIGWDIATLAPIVEPTAIVGKVTARAARATGLMAGTPVVCGTSDTSIETFGAGSVNAGDGTIKLATAGTVSVVGHTPHVDPSLINYPLVVPGLWYTISGTNSCASAHRWLRDAFFMQAGMTGAQAFAQMDELASRIPAGSQGLLFHPYLQGERAPYWDPLLRADFIGLTFAHDRAHLVRALYEGIAFALRDVLEQFRAQSIAMNSARIIGGGAHSATWRQIVADILNVEIKLPRIVDASFGAALVAGVGIGMFPDVKSAASRSEIIACTQPDPGRAGFYDQLFGLYKRAQSSLASVNHDIADLLARQPSACGSGK